MTQPKTVDEAVVAELLRHWDEGWNRGDLATIMAPFAGDVVFSSPFVPKLTGDPTRATIDGYDALRVDAAGKVVEWRCHYVADFLDGSVRYLVDGPDGGPGSGRQEPRS